jgi:hypothetical protein
MNMLNRALMPSVRNLKINDSLINLIVVNLTVVLFTIF